MSSRLEPTVKVLAAAPSRRRMERYSLCRHGFTALCKGLHQTLAGRERRRGGGREAGGRAGRRDEQSAQGWAENRVKLKEQAWLGDHQTRCLMKSDF